MVRGKNHRSDGDREVAVDVTLEVDLRVTEEAIDADQGPFPSGATALGALEELDQQIDLSDDYESRVTGSAAVGFSSKGSVIAETSGASRPRSSRKRSSSPRRS